MVRKKILSFLHRSQANGDWLHTVSSLHVLSTALALLANLLRLLRLMLRSRTQLAAENLFLRKQLACYIERQVRPRRTDNASRITLVLLSKFVGWHELLTIVRPDTLVRWHRESPLYGHQTGVDQTSCRLAPGPTLALGGAGTNPPRLCPRGRRSARAVADRRHRTA